LKPSIHLHFMGASTPKDGPSAGGAIGLALTSVLTGQPIRRDVAMTGEIDTQGRILAVGGLDVKLETAIEAGCKTLIIPKANLHGEGGIERLPEALKRDLQIITYEDWKADHPPFDYEHHVLQVVAVDHIVQAGDISFLDENKLEELETCFLPHPCPVAEKMRKEPGPPKDYCCCLFHPKEPEELTVETFDEPFWEFCRCMFVLRPEVKRAVIARHPNLENKVQFFDLGSTQEQLPSAIRALQESLSEKSGKPACVSLVAPYYFLVQNWFSHADLSTMPSPEDLRLFANNYSLQGFKIKACKPVLNRVLCHLATMSNGDLDTCPFLTKLNGIYTLDLSFIPEKYRLDMKRTEKILNQCLTGWLTVLEGRQDQNRTGTGQRMGVTDS
jgi:hypothetical protein